MKEVKQINTTQVAAQGAKPATKHILCHNLGLGDHFICNGMVRHFHKAYNGLTLWCYKHNKETVSRMYGDLKNFHLLMVDKDWLPTVRNFTKQHNLTQTTINATRHKLGAAEEDTGGYKNPDYTFDEIFYRRVGLGFETRFKEFHVERDASREKRVLDTLNPSGEKFIFIHDNPSLGYNIRTERIKASYLKIWNDPSIPIFDYLLLLEKAKEVHVMQSAFKDLINSFPFPSTDLFYHQYVRKYDPTYDSKGLNKFTTIK